MATTQALAVSERALTALDIRAHVNLIQEVMQAVMKLDTHFGIIPGCKKPSLWKPGAEVLFTTFRISVDPHVEDLSTPDEARFRVTAKATSAHGTPLGSAVGEASSDEEKYKWRAIVCQEEYDATPENRRRTKWKQGHEKPYPVQQVRTEVADHRNTIIKMAAKRAYVALALQVTATSDIFTQDIEDLPDELQHAAINGDAVVEPAASLPTEIKRKTSPPTSTPDPTPASTTPTNGAQAAKPPASAPRSEPVRPQVQSPRPTQVRVISEAQARRFYAIWKGSGRTKEQVDAKLREIGIASDRDIPSEKYNSLCAWAESGDGF